MEKITIEQFYDLAKDLAWENDPIFNYLKLAEELSELSELLLKKVNKAPERQPTDAMVVEEAGDVYVRLGVLIEMLGNEAVETRVLEKGTKLWNWREEGQYKGKI